MGLSVALLRGRSELGFGAVSGRAHRLIRREFELGSDNRSGERQLWDDEQLELDDGVIGVDRIEPPHRPQIVDIALAVRLFVTARELALDAFAPISGTGAPKRVTAQTFAAP